MKAELLLKNLKKVKEFAKETSPYDLAKNVKIVGTEDKVVLQCCDGESGITQTVDQTADTKKVLGAFCVNVFTLTKTVAELPPGADIEVTADLRNNLVMKGKGFRFPLKALPDDRILAFGRHATWTAVEPAFFDDLGVVASMTAGDAAVIYDGTYLYSMAQCVITYTEITNGMPAFKVNAKFAAKLSIDEFKFVDVTEQHIYCKNDECEVFVGQTNVPSPRLAPALETFRKEGVNTARLNREQIKTISRQISALQAWGSLKDTPMELRLKGEESQIIFEGAEMDLAITGEGPHVTMTVPSSYLDVITQKKDFEHIDLLYHEQPTMFIAQVDKIVFVGGLRIAKPLYY